MFVLSNEQSKKQTFVTDYQDLYLSRSYRIIVVGVQRRKKDSSHVHIITLQKKVIVLIPQNMSICQHLKMPDLENSDD